MGAARFCFGVAEVSRFWRWLWVWRWGEASASEEALRAVVEDEATVPRAEWFLALTGYRYCYWNRCWNRYCARMDVVMVDERMGWAGLGWIWIWRWRSWRRHWRWAWGWL